MNIFTLRDFQTQVNFADSKTKKKLYAMFMRKDLQK